MLPRGWKKATGKSVNGTCFQGYVTVSYRKLVSTFGKPRKGDGYKTDAEWWLKSPAGRVVTIYNYKNGKAYIGKRGKNVTQIKVWHIGGKSKSVSADVHKALALR